MVCRVSGLQSDNIAYPDFLLNLDPHNKVEQLQSKQKTIFLWTGNSILDTLNSIPKGLPPPPPVAAKEDFGSIFHKTIRIHADPGYLAGKAGCLGEHVEVARGEGERHRLVHFDCDRLLSLHANIFSTIRKPQSCESRFMESGSRYGPGFQMNPDPEFQVNPDPEFQVNPDPDQIPISLRREVKQCELALLWKHSL